MKVDYLNMEGKYLLTCEDGQSFKVPAAEFWELARIADRIDARGEIEQYLEDCEEIEGVDPEKMLASEAFLEEAVERLISDRTDNETGDQIWDALGYCVLYGEHKDEVCGKVVDVLVEDANARSVVAPSIGKETPGCVKD